MNDVIRVLMVRGRGSTPARPTDEVHEALILGDLMTASAGLGAVADLMVRAPLPDVLLIPASLRAEVVRYLCRVAAGTETAVVAYSDGELGALEECARAGAHLLMPPFRSVLVRDQLRCIVEHRKQVLRQVGTTDPATEGPGQWTLSISSW